MADHGGTGPDGDDASGGGRRRARGRRRAAGAGRTKGVPPAAGAAAMATGIISVGLHLAGIEWASLIFLVAAGLIWLGLGVVFVSHLRYEPQLWRHEAGTPGALTGVAGTAVIGVRFSLLGWQLVAVALLCLAAALWPVLMPGVIKHRHRMAPGAAYLVCVSTQSLVVLAGTLAAELPASWLMWPAICLFVLGLALYLAVLADFDFGQLRTGSGDHWVACGAVSISALAGTKLGAATSPDGALRWATGLHTTVKIVTLILLGFALAWYVVIAFCEARWPRPRYDIRRWSTVFPLGMTAVAAMSSGAAFKLPALTTLGKVLIWPAVIVWILAAIGAVRSATRVPSRSASA